MKKWVYWGLTVAVALMTGVYVYLYLDGLQDTVPVVVAKHDLPVYKVVSARDLTVSYVHRSASHPQAFREASQVVGQTTIEPVYEGEQILKERLAGKTDEGFGTAVQPNRRLFFIPVSREAAIGGYFERGDRVDVYHYTDAVSGWSEARLLLHQVRVMETVRDTGVRDQPGELLGVLVEVSPDDAAVLVFAVETGEVYLALAGHDAAPIWVDPVTANSMSLLDQDRSEGQDSGRTVEGNP